MERRRRPQAARPVFRCMGPGRRSHHRWAQAAVLDPFCLALIALRCRRGVEWDMPMNTAYRGPEAVPDVIPVFLLPGALLLPRGQMLLNIFEPRYLAMIDDALRSGDRLIGMIQPDPAHPGPDPNKPHLFHVACVGRTTQFAESGDGRYLIQLTGVARFRIAEELSVTTPYRQCKVTYQPFVDDFTPRMGED